MWHDNADAGHAIGYRPHPQPLPLKGGESHVAYLYMQGGNLSPPFKGRGWGWGL